MTLLLAEGFEHIHPSARNLPGMGSKVAMWTGGGSSGTLSYYFLSTTTSVNRGAGPIYLSNFDHLTVHAGMVDDQIAAARKGGKAIGITPTSRSIGRWAGMACKVRKSRTLYIGFALRIPTGNNPHIAVVFGRSPDRKQIQDNPNYGGQMTPLGGCFWIERGGYADLEWRYQDQDTVYDQIFHNRTLNDGDWHFFEFATTVYGSIVGDPQGWGEAKVSNVTKRRENLLTNDPGSNGESFMDTISVRVADVGEVVFDDIYVCNDEGDVNNGFLGNIFVRPMSPSHTGNLMESTTVGTTFRHDAVGPAYIGDEIQLPNPLPTPEEDPDFTPWGNPTESHLILPREGAKQNFACTDVGFMASNPRIHGVVADVVAEMSHKRTARAVLTPIKTIGGATHTYFPTSSDMVNYYPSLRQLIMENPNANDPVLDEADPNWSSNAINNSEYGLRADPVIEQADFDSDWNTALLRYPVYHDQTVDEGLGLEDWASRHWEEFTDETFALDVYSRWDWASSAFDGFQLYDETIKRRDSYCLAWSNVRWHAEILVPEEFMKGVFSFGDDTRVDAVTLVEETFDVADTSYHEWVEQLQSWFDPYDFTKQDWTVLAADTIGLEITDIFDNHFALEDSIDTTAQIRSNHEFIGETLYPDDAAGNGIHCFADDGFNINADHFGGNWVEQVEEWTGLNPSILTRHWRFEYFWMVCISWWQIGVVEQPLVYGEQNPLDAKNDNLTQAYIDFFGIDGYYDEVKEDLQTQWLLAGGDPSIDFDHVRWAAFSTFVYEGANVVDMLDADGNSIIEEVA